MPPDKQQAEENASEQASSATSETWSNRKRNSPASGTSLFDDAVVECEIDGSFESASEVHCFGENPSFANLPNQQSTSAPCDAVHPVHDQNSVNSLAVLAANQQPAQVKVSAKRPIDIGKLVNTKKQKTKTPACTITDFFKPLSSSSLNSPTTSKSATVTECFDGKDAEDENCSDNDDSDIYISDDDNSSSNESDNEDDNSCDKLKEIKQLVSDIKAILPKVQNRFKKGSIFYKNLEERWEVYKEVEKLSDHSLEERYQIVAKQQNMKAATVKSIYKKIGWRINLFGKTLNACQFEDILDILSIPYRQVHIYRERLETYRTQLEKPFYSKDNTKKIAIVKKEFALASASGIPESELFSYISKKLKTSETEIRQTFISLKVNECNKVKITSTAMLTRIREEAMTSLRKVEDVSLCELGTKEKLLLSHVELAEVPFALKCSLPHTKESGVIRFCLSFRKKTLHYLLEHLRKRHYEHFLTLDGKASAPSPRKDVHQLVSSVVAALNYPSLISNLVVLTHITHVPLSVAAAERAIVTDLSFDQLPLAASGINPTNKWMFSFFKTNENRNSFKCRLWHSGRSSPLVCPDVYFSDGSLLDNHLYIHLMSYHAIKSKPNVVDDLYKEANAEQPICLQSIPTETMSLITRLLDKEKTLPFQSENECTIDAAGMFSSDPPIESAEKLQKIKSFVRELKEEDFKLLCFFKPSEAAKRNVICRIGHSRGVNFIKCAKGSYFSRKFTREAMINHLGGGHGMTTEARRGKTVAITEKNSKIDLTRLPLDILQFYYNISESDVVKQDENTVSTSTVSLAVKLSSFTPPLPSTTSAWIEIAIIKCMPGSFIKITQSKKQRQKLLNYSNNIRKLIAENESKLTEWRSRNYIVFMKICTNSIYSFLNALLYTGFTANKKTDDRIRGYVKSLNQVIAGEITLEQAAETLKNNTKMISTMVQCWEAGSENFIQYVGENRWMCQNEGLFTERTMIDALNWLPINCNNIHGSTSNYESLLKANGISESLIADIGVAELATYFEKNNEDMHLATPIPIISNQHHTRHPSPTPDCLLSSWTLERMKIPLYSLVLPSVGTAEHDQYAKHLFLALFTTSVKDALWFLTKKDSVNRLNELEGIHYTEQKESINSVLRYLTFDSSKCLDFACQIWRTVFVANVEAANNELPDTTRRFPASKRTHKYNFDFICTTALILSDVIGLCDEKGNKLTSKTFESQIIQFLDKPESYKVENAPKYSKLTLFTDLARLPAPPLEDFIRNSTKLTNRTVTPIDPFIDDNRYISFFEATSILRNFNFSGTLQKSRSFNLNTFKTLPFLYSSRFTHII